MAMILKLFQFTFLFIGLLFFIQGWVGTTRAAESPNKKYEEVMARLKAETARLEAENARYRTWSYIKTEDKARNKEIYRANISSLNSVKFNFPYSDTIVLIISIRKHPEWGQDVIFVINDGQFKCDYDDCVGLINFDGKPEKLTLAESKDGSSDMIFAQYGEAIIKKLLNSKKVIVELPFYQEGNRQFEFATEGLKWPPQAHLEFYKEE